MTTSAHTVVFQGIEYPFTDHFLHNGFTLQLWIKTSASGCLFHYAQHDNWLQLSIDAEGAVLFNANLNGRAIGLETVRGGINDNQWHHVSAVCQEDNQVQIYVNGMLIACKPSVSLLTDTTIDQTPGTLLIGKSKDIHHHEQIFQGEWLHPRIWKKPLNEEQLADYNQPDATIDEDIVFSAGTLSPATTDQDTALGGSLGCYTTIEQEAQIDIINQSPYTLTLVHSENLESSQIGGLPSTLPAYQTTHIILKAPPLPQPEFEVEATYIDTADNDVSMHITITKSFISYDSSVKVEVSPMLDRDIIVNENTITAPANTLSSVFKATVRVVENLVVANARNLLQFLEDIQHEVPAHQILATLNYDPETGKASSSGKQIVTFYQACQIFNRRIQEQPLVIVNCTSTEDVQCVYKAAIENNLPISVRSGGHDHEGECVGTNTVLIDLMGLNDFSVDSTGIAAIGPGNRFIVLTTKLANQGVMIPHGTCATVAIPGFIMGGGWGPWTRKHGMCCEHLVAADIVLGDGTLETINERNKPELLWALKGGGGLSYGIVTRFYIQTFPLPEELIKFELEWNLYEKTTQAITGRRPTIDILTRWENLIQSQESTRLIGTNLKINGKPAEGNFDAAKVVHNCLIYGYWQGTLPELHAFIQQQFDGHGLKPDDIRIDGMGGIGAEYGKNLMGSWDRESYQNVKAELTGESGTPLPPDLDEPAPHKITSRLVDQQGLGVDGHTELLRSLTSPLILENNRSLGLFCYVTLGAIVGDYYRTLSDDAKEKSAFPYKDKLYTIQYQTWWNNELIEKGKMENNLVYINTNRAMDWIEASRDYTIPNTSGAFISFKDASVPTHVYFAQNYQKLVDIKKKFSEDKYNHLRRRKTII